MRNQSLLAGLSALLLAASASADVIFNIDAELLKDSAGNPMPASGLVVLVASTIDSTFTGPTPAAFATGDDQVLAKLDLSAFATPGVLSDTTGNLAFSGNWDAGNPVQLYWFPTLTLADTNPGAGVPFGQYRSDTGLDGSEAWITPADGSPSTLKFFTADSTFLFASGSNPASAGLASFTTPGGSAVPEPSTVVLSIVGALLLFRCRRFHR